MLRTGSEPASRLRYLTYYRYPPSKKKIGYPQSKKKIGHPPSRRKLSKKLGQRLPRFRLLIIGENRDPIGRLLSLFCTAFGPFWGTIGLMEHTEWMNLDSACGKLAFRESKYFNTGKDSPKKSQWTKVSTRNPPSSPVNTRDVQIHKTCKILYTAPASLVAAYSPDHLLLPLHCSALEIHPVVATLLRAARYGAAARVGASSAHLHDCGWEAGKPSGKVRLGQVHGTRASVQVLDIDSHETKDACHANSACRTSVSAKDDGEKMSPLHSCLASERCSRVGATNAYGEGPRRHASP